MTKNDVKEILAECEALLSGHFLLTSGLHSNAYIQCAKLLRFPDKSEKVLKTVVEQLQGLEIDLVCGPAVGGIIVSYELGRQLGLESIFTERENGEMTLRRGFNIKKGSKVLITEDVVTTAKSTLETVAVIESYGAKVVGLACIADRRKDTGSLAFPVFSAIKLDIDNYDPTDCPLCMENIIELTKPGSRNLTK